MQIGTFEAYKLAETSLQFSKTIVIMNDLALLEEYLAVFGDRMHADEALGSLESFCAYNIEGYVSAACYELVESVVSRLNTRIHPELGFAKQPNMGSNMGRKMAGSPKIKRRHRRTTPECNFLHQQPLMTAP